jgi:hypothetical protein
VYYGVSHNRTIEIKYENPPPFAISPAARKEDTISGKVRCVWEI